MKEVRQRIV